ncbi:MAG: hypothetical protein RLZZ70_179 [Candidatus Parcubacteria bacterium]
MVTLREQLNKHTSAIKKLLYTIKREEERLSVRSLAVERCYRSIKLSTNEFSNEEEEAEEYAEMLANVEAIQADLSTYVAQLKDKLLNMQRGYSTLLGLPNSTAARALASYIEEDARLCARDLAIAREGYDELIERLQEMSHLRDQ